MQPAHSRLQFGPILERLADPIREVRQYNADGLRHFQAFRIAALMDALAQRLIQQRQRVTALFVEIFEDQTIGSAGAAIKPMLDD